jgi:hypothetical protein
METHDTGVMPCSHGETKNAYDVLSMTLAAVILMVNEGRSGKCDEVVTVKLF